MYVAKDNSRYNEAFKTNREIVIVEPLQGFHFKVTHRYETTKFTDNTDKFSRLYSLIELFMYIRISDWADSSYIYVHF